MQPFYAAIPAGFTSAVSALAADLQDFLAVATLATVGIALVAATGYILLLTIKVFRKAV